MLNTLKQSIEELGVAKTSLYLLRRLIEKFLPKSFLVYYHIVIQPVPGQALLPPRRGKHFFFQLLAQPDDVLSQLPRPQHIIESRFKQGSVCVAALLEEELVGCTWLQLGPYHEDQVRSIFTPSSAKIAWDYDVYIEENQRSGFLFAKMWDRVNEHLRLHGIDFTASRIDGFNVHSINSHKRLGAETVQHIVYLVFGNLQITLSDKRPWFHISTSNKDAPIIYIEGPKVNDRPATGKGIS